MIREFYFWLLANPFVFLAGAVAAVSGFALAVPTTSRLFRSLHWTAQVAAGVVIVVTLALYYSRPLFLDHVEAQVAAVSFASFYGRPLYHALDGMQAYSGGPYGPGTFLVVQAAYTLFGAGLVAGKLSAAVAVLVTMVGLRLLHSRTRADGAEAGFAVAVAAVALPYCAFFWLRADPWLLAFATTGAACAWRGGRVLAVAGAGFSLGLACWFKVHAPLYFIPVWSVLLLRFGWWPTLAAGGLGVVVAAAQLFPWAGRGENYVALLHAYAGFGGGSWQKILTNLQWSVLMLFPAWLPLSNPAGRARWAASPAAKWQSLALAGGAVAASLIGSRSGAGYWHLLPLVPAAVVTGQMLAGSDNSPDRDLRPIVLTAWWLLAAFLIYTRYDDVVLRLWRNSGADEVREIDAVLTAYPHHAVLMGLGSDRDGPGYPRTFQRAYLAQRRQPYPYDLVVMMDLHAVGLPPEICASRQLLLPEHDTIVLVPHGEEPFTMPSFLGGTCVPESFRAEFRREFSLARAGHCYDVWLRSRTAAAPSR